jgi:hypothetical protein
MVPQFSIETKKIIMDKKLIEQYGEDILCYRLRTARQKKRMQYEDFHKYLVCLSKEENALDKQIRDLGWEPLVPPVQKGWKRFFILREDVARSKQADFFAAILKKINRYDWSWKKDFLVKKKKRGKKIYVVKGQHLLKPGERQFQAMNFTEQEKQFFYPELQWEPWSKEPAKKYVFTEPWRFVLVVRPNMIDKIRIKDAFLESELQRIENYLERNALRQKQSKIVHGYCQRRRWREIVKHKEINGYKFKSINQVLDIIRNDDK